MNKLNRRKFIGTATAGVAGAMPNGRMLGNMNAVPPGSPTVWPPQQQPQQLQAGSQFPPNAAFPMGGVGGRFQAQTQLQQLRGMQQGRQQPPGNVPMPMQQQQQTFNNPSQFPAPPLPGSMTGGNPQALGGNVGRGTVPTGVRIPGLTYPFHAP